MSVLAPAAMVEEWEAMRQKKRRERQREEVEVAASSSESPRPPATPDWKTESPLPFTAETLTLTGVAAGKGCKRKKQEVAAASSLVEEAVRKEKKKKGKRSKHEEAAAATPSPSIPAPAAATAQILDVAASSSLVEEAVQKEEKKKGKRNKHEEAAALSLAPAAAAASVQIFEVAAEEAVVRKEQRRGKLEQGQSGQQPSPVDVHPQGGKAVVDGGVSGSKSVRRRSSGKPRVLTDKEILRMRIASLEEQPVPKGFVPAMANPNSMDQDPKYSSPFGAFFDQFCYRPERRQGHNASSLPKTPDPPAGPPQDQPSFLSSQLNANQKAAKTTTLNTKRPPSASASGSQEAVKAKEKKRADEEMDTTKKPRKKPPLLSAAEKRSDKYRRLPLNQLVPPPRSPYNLLQERYAHDPWKVIIICMLLNLSKGAQVKKKLKGFFRHYPDAQTACTADPEKMAEYLAPLGLQRVNAKRIQKLSKDYVKEEWTHITEICGVDKYAADAYAIFCAGRATEVVPEDHKLVDYWKYVCFELPTQRHREEVEVAASSSESPRPPVTPDSKTESPLPFTAETLTLTGVAAGTGCKRKKQEVATASSLVEEAVRKEKKKEGKRSKHEEEAAATPSPSIPAAAAATAQILDVAASSSLVEEAVQKEEKKKGKRNKHEEAAALSLAPTAAVATVQIFEVAVEEASVRKEQRRGKLEQGQSGQQPSPVDVHPQGGEAVVDGGVSGSKSVRRRSSGKPRVLTDKEILRMRIASLKEQPVPQSFVPAMANPNSMDQDPKYSSPFGAFFDQFCYRPERRQGHNASSLPKTPDPPAGPPQDHSSFLSSQLNANQKAAKTTTLNTKRAPSASASGSQEAVKTKEKKRADEETDTTKKPRKKPPLLSAAEKRSDKYRRLPLDQLVPPPRSPYNLLQERYAHDPWKVMIICMLLNVSQGGQVKKILKGFFRRYPDAQTACTADPEKMAEYLAPLGLQRVRAKRIQKLSKVYIGEEWTYITELYGVGKYAADAYAIFCAGRATEVVPEDHKLVDYWKYVCFELPTQVSQKAEEAAGVTGKGNFAAAGQQIAVSC